MALSRLVSARWLKNHGVMLRYSGNGSGPETRFIRPNGALSVGQVATLLVISPTQVYRLVAQKRLRFRDVKGSASVALADLRRYMQRTA